MASNLQELCVALIAQAVKEHLEPKCNNLPLWDNGLGTIAQGLVQTKIPALTGDQIAEGMLRMMGVRGPVIAPPKQAPRPVVIDAEVIR